MILKKHTDACSVKRGFMYKVSLVLTTYNCAGNVKSTLESIEKQDYPDIEIVVKDGLSTDRTLEIVKEYQKQGKYPLILQSCKDEGLYDAMNQGFRLSTGDIVAIFNERFLEQDAVSRMVSAIEQGDKEGDCRYMGAHCDLYYMDGEKIVRKWKMGEGGIEQGWMPGHPTLFLKREIYEKYGLYNTKYKISADYEFMVRFLKDSSNKLVYVPKVLVGMYYGGTSTSGLQSYMQSLKEAHQALKENGYSRAWLIDFKRTLRVLRQFVG